MTCTITLTQEEIEMLINAANITHLKYMEPDKTEATRKHAKDYGNLCSKLYYSMLEQMDAEIAKNDKEAWQKMESKIKELYDAIQCQQALCNKYVELFGQDDHLTRSAFNVLTGMDEAFKIVAGMTPTDYFIANLNK